MRFNFILTERIKFLRSTVLLLSSLFFAQISFAQLDIIGDDVAGARKQGFHGRWGSSSKPMTRSVMFKVAELQQILDQYKAAGVSEIVFVPALIRTGDDANRYIAKHPELSQSDRGKIANKFTLLIKAPQDGSASLKRIFAVARYYDIGRICPPPEPCLD